MNQKKKRQIHNLFFLLKKYKYQLNYYNITKNYTNIDFLVLSLKLKHN